MKEDKDVSEHISAKEAAARAVNEPSQDKKSKAPKAPTFVERWENHDLLIVRASYTVLHSIWMVVMAVGMFLAWLIALLAT